MKIIKKGSERYFQFTCGGCGSVLEANRTELSINVFNTSFRCPVCKCERTVDTGDLIEVDYNPPEIDVRDLLDELDEPLI